MPHFLLLGAACLLVRRSLAADQAIAIDFSAAVPPARQEMQLYELESTRPYDGRDPHEGWPKCA